MQINNANYGEGASSYHAAGELNGISNLVDAFYANMDLFPEAKIIRSMHPLDLSESRKKLSYFLSGWLGGPRLYSEHYGGINIPGFHKPFAIGESERDAWLQCMEQAIMSQPYETSFKTYLYEQICVPAERVRAASAEQSRGE